MLKRQIEKMQKCCKEALSRERPGVECFILKRCADYLNCPYYEGTENPIAQELLKSVKPTSFRAPGRIRRADPLVCVKVMDLTMALKGAKGIDEDEEVKSW